MRGYRSVAGRQQVETGRKKNQRQNTARKGLALNCERRQSALGGEMLQPLCNMIGGAGRMLRSHRCLMKHGGGERPAPAGNREWENQAAGKLKGP